MTNSGIMVLFSMRHPAESIHLGSLMATSFARCLGRNRVDTMHMGGIITRIARYFGVDVERCSIIGRTEPFLVATLYTISWYFRRGALSTSTGSDLQEPCIQQLTRL
ncbi:unnamed protein product [Linum trigynum]|uniref:Uncharacterized protein n=1 Tax=Linum trigynum TaxID=586398 RepID=A0AAV2ESU4_9ROSI